MEPSEELRFLILGIQREGNRLFAAALRAHGLTPSQAEVVSILDSYGPLTLAGLGELLICDTSTSPSRLVDRLVAQQLVSREEDPKDRRRVTLQLTEQGRRLVPHVRRAEAMLHAAITELIKGEPVEETLHLLRTVADAFPVGAALRRRRGSADAQRERTAMKRIGTSSS